MAVAATNSTKAARDEELQFFEHFIVKPDEMTWEEEENGIVTGVMEIDVATTQPLRVAVANHPSITPVTVSCLPPIKLHFTLQDNYPLSKPDFKLVCSWLNISQVWLVRQLDK